MNVAFYSFKGGVGRSLALAHTAWLLAARSTEQQILAVDLDLEAPGLDCYFRFPGVDRCRGFSGLLRDYQQQPEAERADWLRRVLIDENSGYVVKSQGDGKLGNLWYLPSGLGHRGAPRVSYQQVTAWLRAEIDSQDRSQGWPVLANRGFLGELRAVLEACYAYTLIDSRTGLADESFASTTLLARTLVVCFRLNHTHIDGIRSVVANFVKREGLTIDHPALPVIPVVTPLPTRGGQDIQLWLGKEVLPLFTRTEPPEGDIDLWERSPLVIETPVVRLYEEPYLEIDEYMLVDEAGDLVAGFDDSVPLVQGYRELVNRIALANCRDDVDAALRLEQLYLSRDRSQLALRFWGMGAKLSLDAFSNLQEYDHKEIGPEAVRSAIPILEQWETRIADDDEQGHDDLAFAWDQIAQLAMTHDNNKLEWLGDRAVGAAHSRLVKGHACLHIALLLRLQIQTQQSRPDMAQRPVIATDSADPRQRIRKLLNQAAQSLNEAGTSADMFMCIQQQLDVYRESYRYDDAVAALERAITLLDSRHLEADSGLEGRIVAELCLTLGQIQTGVRAAATDIQLRRVALWFYMPGLGWNRLAREGAESDEGMADIRALLQLTALSDPALKWERIRALSPYWRYYLTLFIQITSPHPDLDQLHGIDNILEEHPNLTPLYCIWAELFGQPASLPSAHILSSPRVYGGESFMICVLAWLADEPDRAARTLRRQLGQYKAVDSRARSLSFYGHHALFMGLHAAFLGDCGLAARCRAVLTDIVEVAPDAVVMMRNSDDTDIARAVLKKLAEQERISAAGRECMDELWRIVDQPAAPPEPDSLDGSWRDALSLEAMRKAATLLERLPQDIDDLMELLPTQGDARQANTQHMFN